MVRVEPPGDRDPLVWRTRKPNRDAVEASQGTPPFQSSGLGEKQGQAHIRRAR
jgi:hypothetical protein